MGIRPKHQKISLDAPTRSVKTTTSLPKNSLSKFPQKHSAIVASNNTSKTHSAFIVNKFILIKLMTESNGSCAKSAQDGYILNAQILIQKKTRMRNFNV